MMMLVHDLLGLVGWMSYWCNGDFVLVVDVVVVLTNMLDLKYVLTVRCRGYVVCNVI